MDTYPHNIPPLACLHDFSSRPLDGHPVLSHGARRSRSRLFFAILGSESRLGTGLAKTLFAAGGAGALPGCLGSFGIGGIGFGPFGGGLGSGLAGLDHGHVDDRAYCRGKG
jgi:hypothetical protein